MRRVVISVLLAVVGCARFASAAAISVAGADCGSPPLLGLTVTVPITGTNITGTECPANSFGAIFGDTGFGDMGPLYGSPIESIGFSISDASQLSGLEILKGSAFDSLLFTDTGFVLFGGGGILACYPSLTVDARCFPDAEITFSGFAPGTTLEVTAVNGITAVPEPATGALILTGLGAAAVRRRSRRRSG